MKYSEIYAFIMLCLHEKAPLKYKFKIFRNVLKKIGIYKSFSDSKISGYIDEGVSHIPFNFLHSNAQDVINILKPYLSRVNVNYIMAYSDFSLRERLRKRGHARLVFLEIDEFIRLNRNVENVLLATYPNYCLTFEVINNA